MESLSHRGGLILDRAEPDPLVIKGEYIWLQKLES